MQDNEVQIIVHIQIFIPDAKSVSKCNATTNCYHKSKQIGMHMIPFGSSRVFKIRENILKAANFPRRIHLTNVN